MFSHLINTCNAPRNHDTRWYCAVLPLLLLTASFLASAAAPPFGALPVHFEEYRAEAAKGSAFIARGARHTLLINNTETRLTLRNPREQAPVTLTMQFLGASCDAQPIGEDQLPGATHWFRGQNPAYWHTGAAHYARTRRQNIYPGIDVVFYGEPQRLEYDFILAPGTAPETIRMAFSLDGATCLPALDKDGGLVFSTPVGQIRIKRPVAYQRYPNGQRPLDACFCLDPDGTVGFSTEDYDPSLPLVLDPVFVFGTYLGGSDLDYAYDVAVDSAGNVYVTGNTMSADFPVDADAIQSEYGGGSGAGDAFIAKINPAGTALEFCTYLGGAANDGGVGIAIDSQRNVYVTGGTDSADFPVTPGAWQTEKDGGRDAFIAKISPAGDALLYSTYLGGVSEDCGIDINADSAGTAFAAGWTNSDDFPVFDDAVKPLFGGGNNDGFACRLSPNGNSLEYSTYLGGAGFDDARGIAVGNDGTAYVTGYTSSRDMFTTQDAFQTGYRGGDFDAFLLKLDAAGTAYHYSTYLGGDNTDSGRGIAVDSNGNAYVTGDTNSLNFPATIGSFQQAYAGGDRDGFVIKINPTGTGQAYGTFLGGGSTDYGYAIALDATGNAYVTGYTFSTDFPVIAGTLQPAYGGSQDAFVAKISRFGNLLSFSTYLGGSLWEKGYGIGLDAANNLYVAGSTGSTDFPITAGAVQPLATGGISSAFVARIAADSEIEGEAEPEGSPDGEGQFEGEGLRVIIVGGAIRTRNVGESVTFNVSISGYTGTVNYTWWFKPLDASDFIQVTAPNSPVYSKYNLQIGDSGKYRCSVTDAAGMVLSPSFTLTVLGAEGEGPVEGEGQSEGNVEGEGQLEGIAEGEGNPEGEGEGNLEGNIEGNPEGEGEGNLEGNPEGEGEGNLEGNIEGDPDGEGEGNLEGNPEGEGEGLPEGEAPCGYSIVMGPVNIPIIERGLTIANLTAAPHGAVRDVNVTLTIRHPMINQLLAQLISPQGVETFLFLYPAQGGAHMVNTILDDDAATPFSEAVAPYTGAYAPSIPLSIFDGNELHGVWTLYIMDNTVGATGYLESWGLDFNPCTEEGEGIEEGAPEAEGAQEGEGEGLAPSPYHSADQDQNGLINLSELLRVIQFFNSGAYHCDPLGEDGYAPGAGDQSCQRHNADYADQAWRVSLLELLRVIQFFNSGGCHRCDGGEDGFCPGPA